MVDAFTDAGLLASGGSPDRLRTTSRRLWPWSTASHLGGRTPRPPPQTPDAVLGDRAYDSRAVCRELRRWRILPVISRKGSPNIKGLGKLSYVVERTFALLHQFKRLAVRWERRLELHNAFLSLACSLICRRRLRKTRS
ncbi:hypothetical protein ACH4LT_02915 [Streptomyces clavifer]|uniref:hypothetical protein n=1 Tax=Streptomyces clavifer TaxID=68188 RepID=UPI0037952889